MNEFVAPLLNTRSQPGPIDIVRRMHDRGRLGDSPNRKRRAGTRLLIR